MTTQDWINEQKIQAVQDRKDGKDYWRTDNLYTEADLIELLEAFSLDDVVGQSEQLCVECKTNTTPMPDMMCEPCYKAKANR